MASVTNRKSPEAMTEQRFVSERKLSELTGRKVRTLQKDRLLGTGPFPWYRLRRQVVYDLDECLGIIAATRVNPAGSGSPNDTVFRGFRNKQPQALNDARHVSIVGDDDILIDVCSMDLLDGGND